MLEPWPSKLANLAWTSSEGSSQKMLKKAKELLHSEDFQFRKSGETLLAATFELTRWSDRTSLAEYHHELCHKAFSYMRSKG